MTIIYFLIMIGVLIAIHEAGHMLTAKAFGLYVREFSIGLGPKIWSHQGKETLYTLRLIPLGGFTGLIESEEDNSNIADELLENAGNSEEEKKQKIVVDESRTFYGANPWKRIAVLIAGPLSNFILAVLIFICLFAFIGQTVTYPTPVVGAVVENSPAYKAGIIPGDKIIKITYNNGEVCVPETTYDITISNDALHSKEMSKEMVVTVLREGNQLDMALTPEYNEAEQRYLMGVQFSGEVDIVKLNFLQAIPEGFKYTVENTTLTIQSIIYMIKGDVGLENMSGTIGIYQYTKEAVSYGLISYISLIGSLSISLAVMNLVPVPVFDGGRIVLTVVEMIVGHRLSKKTEEIIMTIGLVLILMLFVLVTFVDIRRIFS